MQQEQELKVMKKLRLAIESQLLDPKMLSGAAQFYNFAAAWMVRLVDPEDKGLPLASPSMEFSCLPEFCVEDIAMFIINCHRFYADFREIASSLLNGEMLNFAVLLMGSPSHINSPYLRAKLAEVCPSLPLLFFHFGDAELTHSRALRSFWALSLNVVRSHHGSMPYSHEMLVWSSSSSQQS